VFIEWNFEPDYSAQRGCRIKICSLGFPISCLNAWDLRLKVVGNPPIDIQLEETRLLDKSSDSSPACASLQSALL
jgi:hypothetical protein